MKLFILIKLPLFCLSYTAVFSQKAAAPEVKEVKSAIDFEESLSWKEILDKAKKEQKYIFLDCYTTWCGPCKRLEKDVYTVDSVGSFFNENFISVKMQMDKTNADPDVVKFRYRDARFIETTYNIDAYPTLIFFTPQGKIINREAGYFSPKNLINIARASLQPGRTYKDPIVTFEKSLKAYRDKGGKQSELKLLIEEAIAAKKNAIADSLSNVYLAYLRQEKNPQNLYKKDILLFISNSKLQENDPILKLFYPDNKKADAIVNTGFSRFVVDRYIKQVYFDNTKFFRTEIPATRWDSIEHVIGQHFSDNFAHRAVLAAKTEWYLDKQDEMQFPKHLLSLVEKYGMESVMTYMYMLHPGNSYETRRNASAICVNATCWKFVFLSQTNSDLLAPAIRCMKAIVEDGLNDSTAHWNSMTFDTYANLLYKAGRIKEAIEFEQKGLDFSKAYPNMPKDIITSYEETLKKMKEGKPTWL